MKYEIAKSKKFTRNYAYHRKKQKLIVTIFKQVNKAYKLTVMRQTLTGRPKNNFKNSYHWVDYNIYAVTK